MATSTDILKALIFLVIASGSQGATSSEHADSLSQTQSHLFSSIDVNHDAQLTYEEFRAWHERWIENRFLHLDSDGDGKISYEEFKAKRTSRFENQKTPQSEKALERK
ncbi:MAG: EF-hand domain-containing protein [Candidatus Hermodarchaeia archaeon]